MKRCHMQIAVIMLVTLITGWCFAKNAYAEDDIYKRGQNQTFIAGCVDPTTDTEGLPLGDRLDRVIYYVDDVDRAGQPLPDNYLPLFTLIMAGGCTDTSVDLQQFPVNVTLYKLAVAVDTLGQYSVISASRSMKVQSANPNAPGQLK